MCNCGKLSSDFSSLSLANDLRLNSRVFWWPNQILIELEDSKTCLASMREEAEDYLYTRQLNNCFQTTNPLLLITKTHYSFCSQQYPAD